MLDSPAGGVSEFVGLVLGSVSVAEGDSVEVAVVVAVEDPVWLPLEDSSTVLEDPGMDEAPELWRVVDGVLEEIGPPVVDDEVVTAGAGLEANPSSSVSLAPNQGSSSLTNPALINIEDCINILQERISQ